MRRPAGIRDRIRAIEKAWESQKVVDPELGDIDVAGFYAEGSDAVFKVFFIRNGVMIGSKDFYVRNIAELPDSELMHSFITQFYAKDILPPAGVVVRTNAGGRGIIRRYGWAREEVNR